MITIKNVEAALKNVLGVDDISFVDATELLEVVNEVLATGVSIEETQKFKAIVAAYKQSLTVSRPKCRF